MASSAGAMRRVADANTDNTTLGSAKRSIQASLQFDFETPYKGFLNVAAYAYKEWQHDGFASTFPFQPIPNPSGNVDFDPTWAVEISYSQPLGDWPLKFKSLVVIHGPKGCGEPCEPLGPGLIRTTEYLTQQVLVFDVGQVVWNLPQRYVIFGGYRYWKNKFGCPLTIKFLAVPDAENGSVVEKANRVDHRNLCDGRPGAFFSIRRTGAASRFRCPDVKDQIHEHVGHECHKPHSKKSRWSAPRTRSTLQGCACASRAVDAGDEDRRISRGPASSGRL